MAKKKPAAAAASGQKSAPAAQFDPDVLDKWMQRVKAAYPDAKEPKHTSAPTKRLAGRILERQSDLDRGYLPDLLLDESLDELLDPQPAPASSAGPQCGEDEPAEDFESFEPAYDPEEDEEPDFGAGIEDEDDADDEDAEG